MPPSTLRAAPQHAPAALARASLPGPAIDKRPMSQEAMADQWFLYGRSHVAWDDIDYLTHQNSKNYGRTLKIKSKKRWLGIIPREVIYSPKHADKTEEQVVAAIRMVRPDLV